ncbi:DUF397 domain-containing protein [Yinghuangia soli]|uniref:DUF397 domain-containing protein n=1 Tax=Yinghuangia soli TaxID=2908204 RepID=A0AA41U3X2_9ACTN|nr:DUF397 domain-containing protein [Yinghuangia soli]MCF2533173.1 DUF397 domain-containing protein [Yinghuangia soli]
MSIEKAVWRKSSYSGGAANECVEVAGLGNGAGVRDSKDPGRGHLQLTAAAWRALAMELKVC